MPALRPTLPPSRAALRTGSASSPFALAAAEMLLEVSPDGRIGFAAGAFQSRLGQPPDAWLGRHVRDLVALPDRSEFDLAFSTLLSRDRLAPTGFRLNDAAATPMAIAGCACSARIPAGFA